MTVPWPEGLFGPPLRRPPAIDWAALEARSGVGLPPDYRELAQLYPALVFDDQLILLHPAVAGFDLFTPLNEMNDWTQWGPPEEAVEFDPATGISRDIDPATVAGPLLRWGNTANGGRIGCWLTHGEPADWTVVIADRHTRWHYRRPLTQAPPHLLTGRAECPYLPRGWPDVATGVEVQQLY